MEKRNVIFGIKENDLESIPKIFNSRFDLKSLYPNRDRFHISEYFA